MSKVFSAPLPRALTRMNDAPRVNASGDSQAVTLLNQIRAAHDDFRSRNEARLDAIEAQVNDGAVRSAAQRLNGPPGAHLGSDPEYRSLFASFTRNGSGETEVAAANKIGDRHAIQAALDGGSGSSGGYIAPVEWDRKILQAQRVLSPMRRLCNVVLTGASAWKTVWSDAAWGSGWVGETASRPATATPLLSELAIPAGEIYANAAITQRLMDDAAFDLEDWVQQSLSTEFERQECLAFLAGDGVNKPRGFLMHAEGATYATAHPAGPINVLPSGNATA